MDYDNGMILWQCEKYGQYVNIVSNGKIMQQKLSDAQDGNDENQFVIT